MNAPVATLLAVVRHLHVWLVAWLLGAAATAQTATFLDVRLSGGATVPVGTQRALTLRAMITQKRVDMAFVDPVVLTLSPAQPPLHNRTVPFPPAAQGVVVLRDRVLFTQPGVVTLRATSTLRPWITGTTTVTVVVRNPFASPEPPAQWTDGVPLDVAGLSFAGQPVALRVDGAAVGSVVAGPDGAFTLQALLAIGTRTLQLQAFDAGGQSRWSPEYVVEVEPNNPPTGLVVQPGAVELAVGSQQQLLVSQTLTTGPPANVTATADYATSEPLVATVSTAGLVSAIGIGDATITASQDGFSAVVQLSVRPPRLRDTSPESGENEVAVTRETVLRFNAPIDPATVTPAAFAATFGGAGLPGLLHLSADQQTLTLFYSQTLPASATVRVRVDGGLLRTTAGLPIDFNGDGTPGEVYQFDFQTLSLTPSPNTSVCGRVFASLLTQAGTGTFVNDPLAGVRISVDGAPQLFTITDALGNFRLDNAPAGTFFVHVDGATAGTTPSGSFFPTVGKSWTSVPGVETNVGEVYLPEVIAGTLVQTSATQATVVTPPANVLANYPQIAGLQITVPPNALFSPGGGFGGRIGLVPVDRNRLPGQLPSWLDFPIVFSVQTDGASDFNSPVAVRMPNLDNLPAGSFAALWSFNHDSGEWEIVATMQVSADGQWVETLPGQGLLAPGWHAVQAGTRAVGGAIRTLADLARLLGLEEGELAVRDGDGLAVSQCMTSQSVMLNSGEERLSRTDLTVPGRGELHFAFTRTYRSRLAYNGPLGHGWNHNYNESLFIQGNGDVIRQNGLTHIDRWVRQANGSFQAPSGYFSTLVRLQNGQYLLRERDGMQHYYSSAGRLVCLRDRNGNLMLFTYDARGLLAKVVDPFGREFNFVHEQPGGGNNPWRITRLRDFAGREVVYTYDSRGDLIAVRTPVVVGTSTGNDFPTGRQERYSYSFGFSDAKLNHNLLSVRAPQEVSVGGPPFLQWTYGTNPGDPLTYDRVLTETHGGTNASGVPAGGTMAIEYTMLNPGAGPGQPNLPRGRARVTERNGAVYDYFVNEYQHHIVSRRLTRTGLGQSPLRPGEPNFYETRYEYNGDGQRTRAVYPEGNETRYVYGTGTRAAERNLVEERRIAGPRGGGADLVTTFSYEPLFNQLRSTTDPRGNDPGYVPPLGSQSAGRYTTSMFFDYQESSTPVPEAVQFGIDLSGMPRGLGDLNGDGTTNQVAGNPVRTLLRTVELAPGSLQAQASGSTSQAVLLETRWNHRGQVTGEVDAEGNLTEHFYFPSNDPEGDGQTVPSIWIVSPVAATGYRQRTVVDAGPTLRRTATTPPTALTTQFGYDRVGNLTAVINPRGVRTNLEVNALNELVTATRGADISLAAASGQLVTGEGAKAYRTRVFRDFNGRVIRREVEDRDSTLAVTNGFVEQATVFDILGNPVRQSVEVDTQTSLLTQFAYDANELLTEVTQPAGNRVRTEYDERHLSFRTTRGFGSPDASTTQIDYDTNGNRLRLIDAEDSDGVGGPEVTTFTYDGFDRLLVATDALGNRSEQAFDPVGNMVRQRVFGHPAGAPGGSPVLQRDVRMAHDELGRLFRRDELLFVAAGFNPVRTPDLRDHNSDALVTARYEFDALSRLRFEVEDDQQAKAIVYDGASRPVLVTDAGGNTVASIFDANSNPVLTVSTEVATLAGVSSQTFATLYIYDQFDRVVRATDNLGQTVRFGYDSRNNLVAQSDAEGPSIGDPWGIFPTAINGPGNTKTFGYDGLSRRLFATSDLQVGGTGSGAIDTSNPFNPDGRVTMAFGYDANSRMVTRTDDNGAATTFLYDALDRPTAQLHADGTQWVSVYDRDDAVRQVTDPNGTVSTRTYDALSRVTGVSVARAPGVLGTTSESYEYDGLSRRTRSVDDNGGFPQVTERVYDSLSRQLEERQNGRVVSSVFEGDGRRRSCTLPGGRSITHTFDALDRPVTASDVSGVLWGADWIGPGLRELQRSNQNGTQLSFLNAGGTAATGYDAVQRITRLAVFGPGGVPIIDREMAYNRAGVRKLEKRHDEAGLEDRYRYDSLYRIDRSEFDQAGAVGATPRDLQRLDYLLDGVGSRRSVDRTTVAAGVVTTAFAVNVMNEYVTVGSVPWTYSNSGNLLNDGVRAYVYDYKNRLVSVANATTAAPIASYRYDADNRRIEKSVAAVPAQSRLFAYDGWQVCEERSSGGLVLSTYVYSPVYLDEPVQMLRTANHPLGPGSVWLHQNARADVVAATDAVGVVLEKRRYDDFGNADGPVVSGSPFGFQGLWLDDETGLYYARNRHYDPRVGRFLQRDPVWDPANVGGHYTFGGNSPVSVQDPLGLTGLAGGALTTREQSIVNLAGSASAAFEAGDLAQARSDVICGLIIARFHAQKMGEAARWANINALNWELAEIEHGLAGDIQAQLELNETILFALPGFGLVGAGYELGTGQSLISGAEASRWWAAMGVVPLGALVGRGLRAAGRAMDFVAAGNRGSQLYDPGKIEQLSRYLQRRGFELRIDHPNLPSRASGAFDGPGRALYLRSNPTQYEVWHELSHLRQFQKLGDNAYNAQTRLQKEQFVFDTLRGSPRRWDSISAEDRQSAIEYITRVGGTAR